MTPNRKRSACEAQWPRLPEGWHPDRVRVANLPHVFVRNTIARSVADAVVRWREENPNGGMVLDVGCGRQPYRAWVEAAGLRYLGCDHPIAEDVPGDALIWDLTVRPWPLHAASVDAVLCTEVVEHVRQPNELLAECARVARPGALLLLTAPFVWPEHEAPSDYRRFTRFEMRAMVEDAGFEVLEVVQRGGWHLALAQLVGCWATFAWSPAAGRVVGPLVWPIAALLARLDTATTAEPVHGLTLGYSVFAKRRPAGPNAAQ